MDRLVECVPNFSCGRDRGIIDAITQEIRRVPGASLLDVDPGEATNRTVVTFVAEPEAAAEAAFAAIRKAAELIDMRQHRGEHPRQGATDVCPFVPISGLTVEECVQLCHRLAQRVGDELGIPVYLYEAAATRPERRSLADIRVGEYEALAEKLSRPEWAPDYGPACFNPRAGATVIGVRPFLIAYNINLNTRNASIAKEIGLSIRERGRHRRGEDGQKLRDGEGNLLREPGLPNCRATGWFIEEYGCAQVTMNLTDYQVTPIHTAFDRVEDLARSLGARVTGSEIVGLVPKEALLMAGRHYLSRQGASLGVSEGTLIELAIRSLGLREVAPFDPMQKIVEYRVSRPGRLASMTVRAFVDELASDSPAPGGGSVAALCGAMAAALTSMMAALTHGKKGYEAENPRMERLGVQAQAIKAELVNAIDRDTQAFDQVMACFRMPKGTPEQKAERERAVQAATREATRIPLEVLKAVPGLLTLVREVVEHGNRSSLSDGGVAGQVARAAALGAYYNVCINLRSLTDADIVAQIRKEADEALNESRRLAALVEEHLLATWSA